MRSYLDELKRKGLSRESQLRALRGKGYADGGAADDGIIRLGPHPGQVRPEQLQKIPAKKPTPQPPVFQDPVSGYLGRSAQQMASGWNQLWAPSGTTADDPRFWEQKAKGASDVIRGSTPFVAPLAIPAAAAAPAATALSLGTGMAAGTAAESLARQANVPPGQAALFGDVAGLGAGATAPHVVPAAAGAAAEAGTAARNLINQLDYSGMGPETGAFSRKPLPAPVPDVGTLMDNPLDLPGKGLTSDLGQVLDSSMKDKYRLGPKSDPVLRKLRAIDQMHKDVNYGLENFGNAREWYTAMVDGMEDHLQQNRPEFQDPTKRALFKYLLGITSNGVDPETNFGGAMKGWDMYQRDGFFRAYDPDIPSKYNEKGTGLTFRANSYEGAIQRLNQLIQDKGGEQGAVDWLQSEHPVKELKQYYPKVKTKGKEERLGSYIFGEKVGAFGSNLNGIHTELTADKWWSRTWNRWMGTVMATDDAGNPKLDEETGLPSLQDAPRNQTERNLMRDTAAQVAGDLGLNVDELQAVLWYTEQALYRAHGLDASSIGYDEAARNYFSKRAVRPEPDGGNRPPPPGGGANAKPRATQRGSPKAPQNVPEAGPASPPPEVIPGGARGGLASHLNSLYRRPVLDSLLRQS